MFVTLKDRGYVFNGDEKAKYARPENGIESGALYSRRQRQMGRKVRPS